MNIVKSMPNNRKYIRYTLNLNQNDACSMLAFFRNFVKKGLTLSHYLILQPIPQWDFLYINMHRIEQRFLIFFGLFPNIDFYYDQISHPTILINDSMRHFIDSQKVLKD